MAKKQPAKLSTLIREVYSDLKKSGSKQVTIHEVVAATVQRQPKLVEQEKDRLFRDSIGGSVRKLLKSDSDTLRSTQLLLPMEIAHVALPVCVGVRPPGRSSGELDWIETPDITFAQLDEEIARKKRAAKISKDLAGLISVRTFLAPHMESKPDSPIGPVLAGLRLAEERAVADERKKEA